MKNLIPLMALLVLGGSFSLSPVYAGKGKHCQKKCEKASGGDECCKEGDKAKGNKTDKAAADKGAAKEGEVKPAETK